MKYNTIKSRLVATILTGIVVLGTPLYIVAEDEDLTNQLDSIQQQVNQQNSIKADAETAAPFCGLKYLRSTLDRCIVRWNRLCHSDGLVSEH